jgi:hypothetical protein
MPYADPFKRQQNAEIGMAALRARQEDAKVLAKLRNISIRQALKELPPTSYYRRKSVSAEPRVYSSE